MTGAQRTLDPDCPAGATLSARMGHLKHGPGGSGLEGPCDPDCAKCERERMVEAARSAPNGFTDAMREVDVQHQRAVEHLATPSDALTLWGDEAAAYRALQAASRRALEAQQAHAAASSDLRAAIEAMCRVLAPSKET